MTKQEIIERIRDMKAERTSLREELQAKASELLDVTAARDRLQAFINITDWGAIDSGTAIHAGDEVRFGALTYVAKSDHTKALTRYPLNPIYWEVRVNVH